MSAFDQVCECIRGNQNFVLQGGAGSGKTETLKQTLDYISTEHPEKRILCLTYTNLAADEIRSRVPEHYSVSTIHSFLNELIKDYRKNIHQVIGELFRLDKMEARGPDFYDGDDTLRKREEHKRYKKLFAKYASTLFRVKKAHADRVVGKREYDADPDAFNLSLNSAVDELNDEMTRDISQRNHDQIKYNETRFNSYDDLTYGHDGLLEVASILFDRYPLVARILRDKYDCILLDEYQDANRQVVDIFLKHFPVPDRTLVGCFGDSMQSIYPDGIGDVAERITSGALKRIDKADNYRCSEQIKDFINQLRHDGLTQEVAFKTKVDGVSETAADRQGSVALHYSFYPGKPTVRSSQEDKDRYIEALDALIQHATNDGQEYRQLKLTNKSIAHDAGFQNLFAIFSDMYAEPIGHLDRHLMQLQFVDLFELCSAYKPVSGDPNYNLVLSVLKKRGLAITCLADKKALSDKLDRVIASSSGASEVLVEAFDSGLLKKSDAYSAYLERRDRFLTEVNTQPGFEQFKALYLTGKNTFTKMKNDVEDLTEEDFKELKSCVNREAFYSRLFSSDLSYQEIVSYLEYQNEDKPYITMHRTKGTGIDNVLVVLEEYFWRDYDFETVFCRDDDSDIKRKTQKLVYVACSRAKSHLRCVRLVSSEEEERNITSFFANAVKHEA